MILDNENENLKVHEWISKYTEEGTLDIVTGYFTIGALAYLAKSVNDKIDQYRLVLGDIVSIDKEQNRPLDLLNENITIEAALKLSKVARECVVFLKQDKVLAKTLEPNFCHAKSYLFDPSKDDDRNKYFISGSSNLTEAGIGLKVTNNVELNLAETGNNNQYKELCDWFEKLWYRKEAHPEKTIVHEDGSKSKLDFKLYLIQEIERIFKKYTPRDIYFKILFELFGSNILEEENDPDFSRQVGRLENSVIYNTLYDFQKKGVLSLIRMLQKYNGAILADAVGLGKTWSALAVMKFFQKDHEVLLLCPKKLEHNWHRYKKNQDSKFEKDSLDFFVRFHTDMHGERLEKYNDRADYYFVNDKKKLIVIDESHNFRNAKSSRYKFFMDNILRHNRDVKVLLLSATPINNSLLDIRNQFNLMVQGNVRGYEESLGVRNLDYSFRAAQKVYNEWRNDLEPKISDFIKKLPSNFFTLTDSLIVARTRKMIEGHQDGLDFPKKAKPVNLFVTPQELGNFESFEELFEHFPPMLSGYQPSFYLEETNDSNKDILHDERQRDRFLVKMMYILMVKRLESSWFSFFSTVGKIRDHHQNALDRIKAYQELSQNNSASDVEEDLFEDDELEAQFEEFTLGKKRKVQLSDIDAAGNLNPYKKDLKKDLEALDNLYSNLQKFNSKIEKEVILPKNHSSSDNKLEELIKQIESKRKSGHNSNNQKLVIFTVYRDTAQYLFQQLKARGYDKLAMVSGSGSLVSDTDEESKLFEPILERFAPYTKLFKEKEWSFDIKSADQNEYKAWIQWTSQNHPKTYEKLQKPIDILIATDALSEGQNLQDADMVINYDIHWNPVRIIQRMGRIDRLGSPNSSVFGINFWPSNNINSYLDLQGRIEQRMAAMKLAGSEVNLEFSDSFKDMAEDENLEERMKERMLRQMEISFDDLDAEESFGFDDLSLERYRQDLLEEFNKDKAKYQRMPKGVYSGFKADKAICAEDGIIALLGYPNRPEKAKTHEYKVFDLIYINNNGKLVLLNQKEVLDAITFHKDRNRFVPDAIDKGDETAIKDLVNSLKSFLDSQAAEIKEQEDGSSKKTMGKEAKDVLSKLRRGDKGALERVKQNIKVDEKYRLENFDLITWFLVTAE
jgi:ERCC4-related helicase